MNYRSKWIVLFVAAVCALCMASCGGEVSVENDTTAAAETSQPQRYLYTWEEFEQLTGAEQMAFQNSFENLEAFDAWLQSVQPAQEENPWDVGGKQPRDYTLEEFEALTDAQQMAFQNSFENLEAFDAWLQKATGQNETTVPTEAGFVPEEVTWEEFENMTAQEQMAFQNSFECIEDFDAWLQKAQGLENTVYLPWENGGKQPEAYTWAEFEALTMEQQIIFQSSFSSTEAFETWLYANMPQ